MIRRLLAWIRGKSKPVLIRESRYDPCPECGEHTIAPQQEWSSEDGNYVVLVCCNCGHEIEVMPDCEHWL